MSEKNDPIHHDTDAVHTSVSRAYASALARAEAGAPSATLNALAGYGVLDRGLESAAGASFGCGNPVAMAGIRPGDTVLDLGAGAGLDLLLAAERTGPSGRVIGVDMTAEMLAAARRNIAAAGKSDHVEVRQGRIESLPVEDAHVDVVLSNCVVNLSPEKERVFAEIHRVLRPGGTFSISDIVVSDLPPWISSYVSAHVACVAGAISEGEYLAGLADSGLVDLEVADRLVYDEAQLRAMIGSDLAAFGLEEELITRGLAAVVGKVASVRVVGRRG